MSDLALISPEALEDKPVVSRHDSPQPMPQEYDCGCLTSVYITPYAFEMRLARPCGSDHCELPDVSTKGGEGR